MNTHRYRIIRHDSNQVWVTITVYGQTCEFWSDLEHEISQLGIETADVFFDFAIQSGRHNRFLHGRYTDSKLLTGIEPMIDNFAIISVFNEFLRFHQEIVEHSMLSTREKNALLLSLLNID